MFQNICRLLKSACVISNPQSQILKTFLHACNWVTALLAWSVWKDQLQALPLALAALKLQFWKYYALPQKVSKAFTSLLSAL